ncbi:MAG: prephenate dehydrogenase [Candidatus Omnitrophica bacterium]|nr:prephenate dehydrogenase [Candidatus Omnitrophota bacterium]
MRQFNRVTIIGVGLIGGSIGLAIKKRGLAKEVVGVFRRRSTLKKALKRRAVDRGFMNVPDGVRGADLVILATPVSSIVRHGRETMKHAGPGAIITDVGSTKGWIVKGLEGAHGSSRVAFVGSHPMAGSEHNSVEYARSTLLEEAPCIVTRTARTDRRALAKVVNFWRMLGARVKVMTPAEHDRCVALVSHLPHIVAFGLAGAVPEKDMAYAAEGFKDTTRVASSDPRLWADIFLTNKKEVAGACRLFEKYYKNILRALAQEDYRGVVRSLEKAKAKRDRFIHGQRAPRQ